MVAFKCGGSDSCAPASSERKAQAPCVKIRKTWPKEHHLAMEKQSQPQQSVWSEKCSCCACCFPWACRLRVLLILLLLHFLLHLSTPCNRGELTQARCLSRAAAGSSRRARPRLFQQSQRPEQVAESSKQAQFNQALQYPLLPAAKVLRKGYRMGMLPHSYAIKKNQEKLEISL